MKKISILWVIAIGFALNYAVTSCDTTSSSSTYAETDCYISKVVLGTLQQSITTTSSTGEDSTYSISVTGSAFDIYIDQVNNLIYNPDSLPIDTKINKIVFSSMTASGTVAIKSLYTGNDTTFSLSDSTDFSKPRTFKVWSVYGDYTREYTMQLNVHQEEGDSTTWKQICSDPTLNWASYTQSRTFNIDDKLYVFGQTDDGISKLSLVSKDDGSEEAQYTISTQDGEAIDVRSIVRKEQCFYALSNGSLVISLDGITPWVDTGPGYSFDAIAGASTDSIYCVTSDNKIYASKDGMDWTQTEIDEEGTLPSTNYSSTCRKSNTNENFEFILFCGIVDGEVSLWKHDIDCAGDYSYAWFYLPQTEELTDDYLCPVVNQPTLVNYDGGVLLIGLNDEGTVEALYRSWDSGRTWDADAYTMATISNATSLSAVVDDDQFIWIICGGTGQIHRARVNRLAWQEEETIYE